MRRLATLTLLLAAVTASVFVARDGLMASAGTTCEGWRWPVKTLGDRPDLLPVQRGTVRDLVAQPTPIRLDPLSRTPHWALPTGRLPFERQVFRVDAYATLLQSHDDGDLTFVLHDRGGHMVVELPDPRCLGDAKRSQRVQMVAARRAVERCEHADPAHKSVRVEATGVAFFDYGDGLAGSARNGIQLHPLLGFRCLTGL